ncbi:hypothetical protein Bxe_A4550 [Paraburkholderia xenovorans LB400]|uniref:Uncharacterized protein n=1 Tax=Paraburkholderia xenovorans (strain LB400) TaxID=266265 RepID=Q13ZN4_PARXL|nr:hypothetical protein Bxe_A4550 [Paraburkholderia xenovorans LB400]
MHSGSRAALESGTLHCQTPFDDCAATGRRAALPSDDLHLTPADGKYLYGHTHRRAGGQGNIGTCDGADAVA